MEDAQYRLIHSAGSDKTSAFTSLKEIDSITIDTDHYGNNFILETRSDKTEIPYAPTKGCDISISVLSFKVIKKYADNGKHTFSIISTTAISHHTYFSIFGSRNNSTNIINITINGFADDSIENAPPRFSAERIWPIDDQTEIDRFEFTFNLCLNDFMSLLSDVENGDTWLLIKLKDNFEDLFEEGLKAAQIDRIPMGSRHLKHFGFRHGCEALEDPSFYDDYQRHFVATELFDKTDYSIYVERHKDSFNVIDNFSINPNQIQFITDFQNHMTFNGTVFNDQKIQKPIRFLDTPISNRSFWSAILMLLSTMVIGFFWLGH